MSDWISVKDRLPDTFDDVLVYSNDCFISIAWREERTELLVGIGTLIVRDLVMSPTGCRSPNPRR